MLCPLRTVAAALCGVLVLAGVSCGDDGNAAAVPGTAAPTASSTFAPATSAPVSVSLNETAASITFDARLVDRDGLPWIEIEFTSDPPPEMALWAVRVNGFINARTNHVPGGHFAFLVVGVVDFDAGVEVSVLAETADRTPLAESEPVLVTLGA